MMTVGPADFQEIVTALGERDASAVWWDVVEDGPARRLNAHVAHETLCAFSIEVEAKGGRDYGFYFGHGAAFESIDPVEFEPRALVDAVLRGAVRERAWRLGNSYVARSEARLQLPDGRVLTDTSTSLPGVWRLTSAREVEYQPYPMKREGVSEDKWRRFCGRLATLMRGALDGTAVSGRAGLEEASRLLDIDDALTDPEVRAHLEYVIWEIGGSPDLYMQVVTLLKRGTSQEELRKFFQT